ETLVPKGTPIPTSVSRIFSTPKDNQTAVPINVLEGEDDSAVENRPLGVFRLTGIRKAPRGVPRIEVKFDIDANGILTVSATDKETNKSQNIVVTGRFGLEDDDKERMKREHDVQAEQAKVRSQVVELRNRCENVYNEMGRWLEYNAELLPGRVTEQLRGLLLKLGKAMAKNDVKQMEQLLGKLTELSNQHRQAG
ncbi:MAG: Hsp70 family protein, partial [Planctomycetota bacterium]